MENEYTTDLRPDKTVAVGTDKVTAEDKPILTVAETAQILGVSPKAIYALAKQAYTDFPTFKVGKRILISRELLFKWIQHECEKPSA